MHNHKRNGKTYHTIIQDRVRSKKCKSELDKTPLIHRCGGGGGDGGGPWGLASKGRGYDFDVCARLENSTITPSLIFLKFFSKNFKIL